MVAAMEAAAKEEQLVAFLLANETYGLDISLINEIIRMQEITQIPRAQADIEGVINLRGKIVPIMDLRSRLALATGERNAQTRIIVVEIADCTVGIVVDSVIGVLHLPCANIEPPSDLVSNVETDYIRGVGRMDDRLIILLDMPKVLRMEA